MLNILDIHSKNRTLNIFPLAKQEEIRDNWLKKRLETVLKEAMEKAAIPMWIVVSKEYNEDPVVESLTPCLHDSSGRLSIFIFVHNVRDDKVERYLIGSPHPALVGLYEFIWDRNNETPWECLQRFIIEKQPEKIGINHSDHVAVADGLTHSLYKKLTYKLGPEWVGRLVSAEQLVTHWFLKRTEEEMITYRFIADLTNNLAKTALSNEVIYPGITTTKDVVTWIRQRVLDLGLKTSFYPTVDIQRQGASADRLSLATILPGDIVHLDFGLDYLGLCTDTQQLAYVLKQDERDVPKGLANAFKEALVMEDIVMEQMVPGVTGNAVFTASITKAKEQGLNAMLYSHPVGRHCHEAGPYIGLFDQQRSIPFKGDFEIVSQSAYALEFNVKVFIPEWHQETFIFLEQPIAVFESNADYLTPRQEMFYLIR